MALDAESYLQSGSNEVRVLEYTTCGYSFGINILKVQKILAYPECLTTTMNSHPSIIGVFKDNSKIIPLIDMGNFLGYGKAEHVEGKKVIITEFFNVLNAFLVDSVEWIHHFVWGDVINANDILRTIKQKYIISIVKPDGERMVPLLDYETIILDLCPELGFKEMEKISRKDFDGTGKRILIAEDSPSVRNMLGAELTELGFEVVTSCDGTEAIGILNNDKAFDLVISDVEMPQMDGLALTTAIRGNPEMEKLPVIVYSSIGDIGMKARAAFLKADAHVTKLSVEELMDNVMRLTGGTGRVSGDKDTTITKDVESPKLDSELVSVSASKESSPKTRAAKSVNVSKADSPNEDKPLSPDYEPESDVVQAIIDAAGQVKQKAAAVAKTLSDAAETAPDAAETLKAISDAREIIISATDQVTIVTANKVVIENSKKRTAGKTKK